MTVRRIDTSLVLFLALAATACGGRPTGESSASSGSGGESHTAMASGLTGTVGGAPWQAVSAVAGASITGESDRNVAFYAVPVTCAQLESDGSPEGGRDVSVTVTWTDGWTASPPDGAFERARASAGGTVTVVHATAATGPGARVRIEMQGADPSADSISGEIDVIDCGPNQSVRAPTRASSERLALAR
jgi:hypothetical protein